jgi:hypothetical protein
MQLATAEPQGAEYLTQIAGGESEMSRGPMRNKKPGLCKETALGFQLRKRNSAGFLLACDLEYFAPQTRSVPNTPYGLCKIHLSPSASQQLVRIGNEQPPTGFSAIPSGA